MKVFETLIVFIIISKSFGSSDWPNNDYLITVKSRCKCTDRDNEEVYIKLLEDRGDNERFLIKSNSDNSNVKCGNDYNFQINDRDMNKINKTYVEITRVGCEVPPKKMEVMKEKDCKQLETVGTTRKFICQES